MVFLELSTETKQLTFPLWIADTYYSMQLFYKLSIGTYSQQDSPSSALLEPKVHFPKNFKGKEKTPRVRQQI